MPPPLRILFVAEASAAVEALVAARQGGPVEARLAPTAGVLRQALAQPQVGASQPQVGASQPQVGRWDAVVFVPGGPVGAAEVAALVPGGVPLFVVGAEVPRALAETAAQAVDAAALAGLHARLAGAGSADLPGGSADLPGGWRGPSAVPGGLAEPSDAPAADARSSDPADPFGAPDPTVSERAGARRQPDPAPLDDPAASLADHLEIGLYRSSPDDRILYANPALASLLGVASAAELSALDIRADLGYPRDAFLDEIRASGVVRNLVVSWTRPSGARVHVRENARAVHGPDGELLYYEGTMEDVTSEVEARQEEQAVARQHQAVAAFAAAEATDADSIHAAAAAALLAATDAAWACLVVCEDGRNRIAATAGAAPPRLAEALAAVLADVPPHPVVVGGGENLPGAPEAREAAAETGIEALVPVLRAGEPLGVLVWGDPHGRRASPAEIRGAEALAWHVGGHLTRAEALTELRDTEATLALIAERTPHVLYRLRYAPEGPVYDYLSPAVEALTGYTRAELDTLGGFRALVEHREVLEGEALPPGPGPADARYHAVYRVAAAGGARWVEDQARTWLDPSGQPVGYVGILQDITERRQREDAFADAAQTALVRQRALVDLSHLGGADGAGAPAAAVAAATLGATGVSFWLCSGDEPCRALYAPPSADRFEGSLASVVRHLGQHRSLDIADAATDARVDEMELAAFVQVYGVRSLLVAPIRRDGRVDGLVVVHRARPHAWDPSESEFAAAVADSVALALERDEREQAVAALHDSEQRYRALSEMTSDYAFATLERDGQPAALQWATGACARISGYTLGELATPEALRRLVHPDSLGALLTLAGQWRALGEARGEIQIVTQSSQTRWVDHHARVGAPDEDGATVVYHSGQDVTARKQTEAALVGAREAAEVGRAAAERINQLKGSFLANMSHEIRTPLTGILGFADLLAAEVGEDQRPFVNHIERNGRRLLDTLNAVLDLSQLEAGEYQASLVPTRLEAAVREAAARFEGAASRKGLRFHVEADPDAAAAIDPAALSQIAGHLVSNAVKFTDAGGVLVSVEAAPERAILRVADTGLGISAAFLPFAFDAFRQEDTGHDRSHEGSGLGLTVVQRLVRLLGGHVEIESEQPGGTAVTVSFPRVPPPTSSRPSRAGRTRRARARGSDAPADSALEAPPETRAAPAPGKPAAPPAEGSRADLLGTPFDFTFLTTPAEAAVPSPPAPPDSPAMFDFRFGRSAAPSSPPPDPAPSEAAPSDAAPAEAPAPEARSAAPTAPPAFGAAPAFGAQASPPAAPPVFQPVQLAAAPLPAAPQPTVAPQPATFQPAAPPAASQPSGSGLPAPDPAMIVRARPSAAAPPAAPSSSSGAGPAGPLGAAEAGDAGEARPSVLVVEDNDDTRMLLDRILRSVYNVTAVGDARSALLAMNESRFAGLVLDINLGGKETGADVLRIARSLPNYGGVFAIALTAYALPGDRERLLESGFDEYISKPFTRQSLMDTLAAGVQA